MAPRSPAPVVLVAALAAGLLVGLALGAAVWVGAPRGSGTEVDALRGEVQRLNATVANMSDALSAARAEARLAQVAANQAGVTEVATRLAEVARLLEAGQRSEAFAPLRGLLSAAGNTSWAPLLHHEARAVHENASDLYEAMSFGTANESALALASLKVAVGSLEAVFQDQYLPYHGAQPLGALVEMEANLSGFTMDGGAGSRLRNPTLRLAADATMLFEVTNTDNVVHNIAVPSLLLISKNVRPGDTVGLVVGPAAAGDYRYFCDVGGHETAMSGHLIVGA